ncbi:MAG: hypothetical protein IJX81_01270 [Clostridia bacterium]|nr:hypothetical protein [Clostridia bacterium]
MSGTNKYLQYLKAVARPFRKITKLDFLQPDNSVAFSLGNTVKRGYMTRYDTRAFIQGGTLNVSLNNGQRRRANITLSNLDGAFEYSVNKIWFGQKVRLSMGLILPDGTEFFLPQGVFYIKDPQNVFKPNDKSVSFPLYDKWAYLDGTLAGKLNQAYSITVAQNPNVLNAMASILRLSKFDHLPTSDKLKMIDSVVPIFTNYYNNKTYSAKNSDGSISADISMATLPYDITENSGGNFGNLLLQLNKTFVGLIGYDQTGAMRVEPSQEDISDSNKPILWNFSPENSQLCGFTETHKNGEVYNDILITGEGLTGYEVWGKATNYDPSSDTNVNLIGLKTFTESRAEYWNSKQCADLAEWYLKRKTILQKSVTIECSQLFHLIENRLVTIKRTDKQGSPVERHLINSFSLPIGETGSMSINAVSVNDFPIATIKQYSSESGLITN